MTYYFFYLLSTIEYIFLLTAILEYILKKKIPLFYKIILICVSSFSFLFFTQLSLFTILIGLFLIITTLNKLLDKRVAYLFSIYSALSFNLVGHIIFLLFPNAPTLEVGLLLEFISAIFSFLINLFILHLVRSVTDYLRRHSHEINPFVLITVNICLTLGYTIQVLSYLIENNFPVMTPTIRIVITLSLLSPLLFLLVYINGKCKELEQQKLQEQKELQLNNLATYVTQIEGMYNELLGFRHDYRNVLISMNESIQTGNMNVVKDTYQTILSNEGIAIDDNHHSLTKLNNLKTLSVKGIVSTQVIHAWQLGLTVGLEVEDVIQDEAIDELDYVRIVSILLTNAIEAAQQSKNKRLSLACFVADQSVHIVIENAYGDDTIDTSLIFLRGYSTKGDNRGIGLSNVMMILEGYDNVYLQTDVTEDVFTQHLTIRNNN